MASSFLADHPNLRSFILPTARLTGTVIGYGSYGSIEEVELPGAICAAKRIHSYFQDASIMAPHHQQQFEECFLRECQLMSTLRHPNIVQFLGVFHIDSSPIPAIVMEKLTASLHDILDPTEVSGTKQYIPLSLKFSILQNVASGVLFLHSHTPPIIHRDLSARNVLLNEGMVAKIADLGMARIMPTISDATMTRAPGAAIYMPPEALEDESKYNDKIDVFSFGVVAIFTLSETFPDPLAPTYVDKNFTLARTELERRITYVEQIVRILSQDHPAISMIQHCMENSPIRRPNIQHVIYLLEQARGLAKDGEYDLNKLELVQVIKCRNNQHKVQQQQNEKYEAQIEHQQRQIDSLKEAQRVGISMYISVTSLQKVSITSQVEEREEVEDTIVDSSEKAHECSKALKRSMMEREEHIDAKRSAKTMSVELKDQRENQDQRVKELEEERVKMRLDLHRADIIINELQQQLDEIKRQENNMQAQSTKVSYTRVVAENNLELVSTTAEKRVIITNDEQQINWDEYGMELHVQPNSLPKDLSEVELRILVPTVKNYKLPTEDGALVSAIYSFSHNLGDSKLCLPVTLRIQHCVSDVRLLKNLQILHSDDLNPPWQFQPFPESEIDFEPDYAKVKLKHFCSFCVYLHCCISKFFWGLKSCTRAYYIGIKPGSFQFQLFIAPDLKAALTVSSVLHLLLVQIFSIILGNQ